MTIKKNKIVQTCLISLSFLILFYTYYYLPNQNKGSIKIKTKEEIKKVEEIKYKNTFSNTEYILLDKEGNKYTTKAKESFVFQDEPGLIYLNSVNSFTLLKKDKTIIEIKSNNALINQKNNETTYSNNVIITNKNYLITSNTAKHIAKKNLIIIDGDVIMKDLTNNLSHIAYCDTIEIDTSTNNMIAFMKNKNKKVLVKKIK